MLVSGLNFLVFFLSRFMVQYIHHQAVPVELRNIYVLLYQMHGRLILMEKKKKKTHGRIIRKEKQFTCIFPHLLGYFLTVEPFLVSLVDPFSLKIKKYFCMLILKEREIYELLYLWCFQIEKCASIPCWALRYESHWLSCFFWYNLASLYVGVSIEWNMRNFFLSSNGTTYWICDLGRHCNLAIWDKLHLF